MAIATDVLALASGSEDGSDTNFALTTTGAVAAGGSIFMAIHAGDVSISGVADNGAGGSLTWTQIGTALSSTGRRIWLYRAYAPSGLASGTVITVTFATATSFKSGCASSFTGLTNTSPQDGSTATNTTGNQTNYTGAQVTTSNADDIIIGVAETDGNGTPTHVGSGSYTEANEIGISAQVSMAMTYRIVSATGNYSPTGTWSSSQASTGQAYITAAFKASAGAPEFFTKAVTVSFV